MTIPDAIRTAVLEHLRSCLPNEGCGLLAGRGHVEQYYPLINALASPTAYAADERSLFAAFKTMRQQGHELLAVVHSHPTSAAVPSQRDIAEWHYDGCTMVIVDMRTETWGFYSLSGT